MLGLDGRVQGYRCQDRLVVATCLRALDHGPSLTNTRSNELITLLSKFGRASSLLSDSV